MGGISDNGGATAYITCESFTGGEANISSEAKPENPLAVFTGAEVVMVMM